VLRKSKHKRRRGHPGLDGKSKSGVGGKLSGGGKSDGRLRCVSTIQRSYALVSSLEIYIDPGRNCMLLDVTKMW
jgi:hypothetical protein